jgi:hypothetical protein
VNYLCTFNGVSPPNVAVVSTELNQRSADSSTGERNGAQQAVIERDVQGACVDSVLRVVPTLVLIQHLLPKMGHKNLLVTQNLNGPKGWGTTVAAASVAPQA